MGFQDFMKRIFGRIEQPEPLLSKMDLAQMNLAKIEAEQAIRVAKFRVDQEQTKAARQLRDNIARESATRKADVLLEQGPAPSNRLANILTPQANRGVERRRVDYIAHLQHVARDIQSSPVRDSYMDIPKQSPKTPKL